MRRFYLDRIEDATGVSGTGIIAEGVVFTDGTVVLRWRTAHHSTGLYNSLDEMVTIHGHDGRTVVKWIDSHPYFGSEAAQAREAVRAKEDEAVFAALDACAFTVDAEVGSLLAEVGVCNCGAANVPAGVHRPWCASNKE